MDPCPCFLDNLLTQIFNHLKDVQFQRCQLELKAALLPTNSVEWSTVNNQIDDLNYDMETIISDIQDRMEYLDHTENCDWMKALP